MSRLPQPHFSLVTAVGADDHAAVEELRDMGIDVKLIPGSGTVYFENAYGENSDHRTQRVLAKANPFRIEHLTDVHADIFHLAVYWPTTLLPTSFATSPPKALYRSMYRGAVLGRKHQRPHLRLGREGSVSEIRRHSQSQRT